MNVTIAGEGFALRRAVPDDVAFILSTWLKSHAQAFPSRERRAAMGRYRGYAESRLAEHGALVACSPSHPSTIHGWACVGSRLHYVYVPFGLRGHGLARSLLSGCFRGYPDRIEVTRRWPWASQRFVLVNDRVRAA